MTMPEYLFEGQCCQVFVRQDKEVRLLDDDGEGEKVLRPFMFAVGPLFVHVWPNVKYSNNIGQNNNPYFCCQDKSAIFTRLSGFRPLAESGQWWPFPLDNPAGQYYLLSA